MPPCAQRVEPSSRRALVTTTVRSPAAAQRSAAVSPATPEPTTTTSASMAQPGAGGVQPYAVSAGHEAAPKAPKVRGMLSISRVVPTRAATARTASPV